MDRGVELRSKVASGLILALLLMGMLSLAFNFKPAKASPATILIPEDYPAIASIDGLIRVSILIDYGNGTTSWYEQIMLPKGSSVFNATLAAATVNYTSYGELGVFVEAINNVWNSYPYSWTWLYWNLTDSTWYMGPVACDQYVLTHCDIIAWFFENVKSLPPSSPARPQPRALTVDDDGPADFLAIQDAINAANRGDTIYVRDGTYYENLVVSKELSLVGEDNTTTIIDGREIGTVVAMTTDNVMICGFTIRGSRKPSVEYTPSTDTGVLVFAGYTQTVENATIFNNDIRSNYMGIFIWYSLNNTIVDNKITNNFIGFGVDEAIQNSIIRNTLSNNVGAIWLGSGGNKISGNNISLNSEYGMQLDGSVQNTVDRNFIANNSYGIELSSSSNNIVTGNNITNNYYGVALYSSSDNKIHHNNFLNNMQKQVDSSASTNEWDDGYPSGGNYWSNYTGGDSNGDGLGIPGYLIDVNNMDHYPLMGPFNTFFVGTWDGTTYNVDVVSNSTISDFTFNLDQKTISFNVTGSDGALGFCRVAIPNKLLGGPYIILLNDSPIIPNTITRETHTFLYFTYYHSTKQVTIAGTTVVPEFPSATILLVLLALAMFGIAFLPIRICRKPKT